LGEGVLGLRGYKKGYLVKIGVYFIGNMYWEGVQQKDFGVIYQYLVKLGVLFNIP
jgi:hypothetical protein